MLVRSANLSSMHMRLSASASSSFRPLSPHAFRCLAEASSSRSSSDAQESSSFRNNLRKGFAPLKKEKPIKNAHAPTKQGAGEKLTVLGGDEFSMERWREVDKKMNKYPGKRTFTAIGTGGADFSAAMIRAVEAVLGQLPPDSVLERPSSGGAYLSVKLGPVMVESPDQVVAIFANMKTDPRLKWFI